MSVAPAPRLPATSSMIPRWVAAVAVTYALLAAASALIAALQPALLVSSHAQINDAARVYAGYLVSRNAAIVIIIVAALALRRAHLVGSALAWAALVQMLDLAVDAVTGRWVLLPGLLILTGVLATAASRIMRPSPPFVRRPLKVRDIGRH